MSVRSVKCPSCQVKLNVKNEITRFKCPKCQTVITDEPVLTTPLELFDSELLSSPLPSSQPFPLPSSLPATPLQLTSSPASGDFPLETFPVLNAAGPRVDPNSCIEPNTGLMLAFGYLAIAFGVFVLALSTFGVGCFLLVIAPLVAWFNTRKAMATIHGSGIQVGPNQFPEIYTCMTTLWSRLSDLPPPEIYIIEASVMNAFAVRLGKKNVVLLTDDMIHGCLRSKNPQSLVYVIAHELGHVALNHNSPIRSALKQYKSLSRLDEYSADRVAMRLVNDPRAVVEGIVLLTVGAQLLPFLNYSAIQTQAMQVASNRQSKKAEKQLTHPLLLNRLDRAFRETQRS